MNKEITEKSHSEIAEPEVTESPEVPELDVSEIPEDYRPYIDPEKFDKNKDTYKKAWELGHKPKELWIAAGKDEDDWFPPGVFIKQREEIHRNHQMAREVSESKKATEALVATFEQEKQAAIARAIAEHESQLAIAIESGDARAAVQLTREIDAKKAMSQAQSDVTATAESILSAVKKQNPLIDKDSPSFDSDAYEMFEAVARAKGDRVIAAKNGQKLNESEFQKILSEASAMVKSKVTPAKPIPKAPSVSTPATKKPATVQKLTQKDRDMIDHLSRLPGGAAMAERYKKNLSNNA